MKAKIRNEIIEEVSFFDSLSRTRYFCPNESFAKPLHIGQADGEGMAASPLAQGWEFTIVDKRLDKRNPHRSS
jgi:hypothetical protein